jgi:hypothetical protein
MLAIGVARGGLIKHIICASSETSARSPSHLSCPHLIHVPHAFTFTLHLSNATLKPNRTCKQRKARPTDFHKLGNKETRNNVALHFSALQKTRGGIYESGETLKGSQSLYMVCHH